MKVVIAPDSFKESLDGEGVAQAIADGVKRALPDAECELVPMSDGGDGFTASLASSLNAEIKHVETIDALGRPVTGFYGLRDETAVLEAASVVGIDQVAKDDRDIRNSDTRGLGALITAALDAGARDFVVGLGGSATNDAGAGMLAELGVSFTAGGESIGTTPTELEKVDSIDISGLDPRLKECRIRVACDVNNPLCGDNGASAIFGHQKGASDEDVAYLDKVLAHVASVADLGGEDTPGAGAAGGLGWAMGVIGGDLVSGIDLAIDTVGLKDRMSGADLVFTGEGGIDRQTLMGKAPAGVASVAADLGIPVIALAGSVGEGLDELYDNGFTAVLSVVAGPCELEDAMGRAAENIAQCAEAAMRIYLVQSARS